MFSDEIKRVSEKVNALKNENTFIFSLVTDVHLYPNSKTDNLYYKLSLKNMKAVNDKTRHNVLFHLGDVPGMDYKNILPEYWTKQRISEVLLRNRNDYGSIFEDTYFVAGNHDGEGAAPPDQKFWYDLLLDFNKEKVCCTKDKIYYYVDFPKYKVRAICLMACSVDENKNQFYGYYSDQLEWLRDDALITPEEYKILLFTHIDPIDVSAKRLDNIEEFIGLMKAYAAKTTFEGNLLKADFTQNAKGTLSALFAGHGHVDWWEQGDRFPCIVIETASNLPHYALWEAPETAVPQKRNEYDTTADLWETVVFDTRKNTLDLVRFGAGDDRHFNL